MSRWQDLLAALWLLPGSLVAAEWPASGWVSAAIEVAPSAPRWCCLPTPFRKDRQQACQLDHSARALTRRDGPAAAPVRLYAELEQGQLRRLAIYAADCPVESREPITDLGVQARGPVLQRIEALAVHPDFDADERLMLWAGIGDAQAVAVLQEAGERARDHAQRDQAWMWLGLSAAAQADAALLQALTRHREEEAAESILLGISQLPGPRAVIALARALEDRSLPLSTRKRALFWLAQSDDASAEPYLARVLSPRADP